MKGSYGARFQRAFQAGYHQSKDGLAWLRKRIKQAQTAQSLEQTASLVDLLKVFQTEPTTADQPKPQATTEADAATTRSQRQRKTKR